MEIRGCGHMSDLAKRIFAELQVLIGQPIADCWRAADMAIFEFGSRHRIVNRKGDEVEVGDISLHVQCRWRVVDAANILFGSDDLYSPADESVSFDDFDRDKQESVLDIRRREWIVQCRDKALKVIGVAGDAYGGFQSTIEDGITIESFPCDSIRDEYSEHWRLRGHRPDESHFVVAGYGIEGVDDMPCKDG
jgi:hypothetical protein